MPDLMTAIIPSKSVPADHASRHNLGGADALDNAAYLDVLTADSAAVNNSETYVNSGLAIIHATSSDLWQYFEMGLLVKSNLAAGIKFTIAAPAGGWIKLMVIEPAGGLVTYDGGDNIVFDTSGNDHDWYIIKGMFWSTTVGSRNLQFAQQSAHASDSIVEKGSYIKYFRSQLG